VLVLFAAKNSMPKQQEFAVRPSVESRVTQLCRKDTTIALSFITVGEQYAGYLKMISAGRWNTSHLQKLEAGLRLVVVVPYDVEVCKEFGDLKATLKNPDGTDRTMATNDLWIAACAKRHSLTLVTNNRGHFEGIPGLKVISEAPGPRSK
jgi:tRNA(fMet)-specific endonuclease VapC